MSDQQSKSGWDENGIYREYGEDGTLLLEQTSYGSVNPLCSVGMVLISGMGINVGSHTGKCDDYQQRSSKRLEGDRRC